MYDLLQMTGGLILLYALHKSAKERNSSKSITIFVVITMYWIDISIGHWLQVWIAEGSKIFIVRAFAELTLVLSLHLKPCRETVAIMFLALISVIVNMIGFSVDVKGIDPDYIINPIIMAVFYLMLLVLISKRFANGLYQYINCVPGIRGYCSHYLKIDIEGK